ncbi:pimeloyl-ACP methyl ester esterase BioH [Alcanivorax sp. JB21]|uniref:pimeloyl-ACP methyl ester esterase BioH n=1 Tax=Alcanivorax limicola TaxID=2874102 RepID=UPI001CBF8E73|nr:pimeloyl-ACP methyl ester esterase BioH [Alcanivorax limicola]MBZ2189318.1 pimeloyl-ACP methyl ester esterase BioH [Alcanivorax limicola]
MATLIPFHNTYQSTAAEPDGPQSEKRDLVLLHGWGLHSIVWDDVMPGLLAHFRVTVIDLPGMGQSPLPNDDYTLDFLVEQMAAVMPDKAHVLGWSLGGMVGIALAARYPQRVQSLITVGTSPRFTTADGWPAAMAPAILDKFTEVFDEDEAGTLIRFLALNCKGSATQRDDTRRLKEILYFCGLPAGRALRGGLAILRDVDLRDALASLKQPLLMLFGENDNLVPAAVIPDIQHLHPEMDWALLADMAHVPFVSAPDIFLQAVLDFYREQEIVPWEA